MFGLPLPVFVILAVLAYLVFDVVFGMLVGRFLRAASRDPVDEWLANLRRRP